MSVAAPLISAELPALLQVVTFLCVLGASAWVVAQSFRGSRLKILQEEATGWEGLAKLRSAEIDQLTSRVTDMESRVVGLRNENDELRSLNLSLQVENVDLRDKVLRLQNRVRELELRYGLNPQE